MIPATAALEWAWRHWKLIAGGIALSVLGLVLLLAKADARHWEKQSRQNAEKLKTEQAKHALTRMSVDRCTAALDDQSKAVAKLAADSDARMKAAADSRSAAQEAAKASGKVAAALDASAAVVRPEAAACPPSDTFWAGREAL